MKYKGCLIKSNYNLDVKRQYLKNNNDFSIVSLSLSLFLSYIYIYIYIYICLCACVRTYYSIFSSNTYGYRSMTVVCPVLIHWIFAGNFICITFDFTSVFILIRTCSLMEILNLWQEKGFLHHDAVKTLTYTIIIWISTEFERSYQWITIRNFSNADT